MRIHEKGLRGFLSLTASESKWSIQDVSKGITLVALLAVLSFSLGLLGRGIYPDHVMVLGLAITLFLEMGMLAAVWIFGVRRSLSWAEVGLRFSSTPFAHSLLPGLVLMTGLGASVIYGILASWTKIELLQPTTQLSLNDLEWPVRLATAVIIVGIGPLVEEIFFRGFVLTGLVSRLGIARGMVISCLLFAVAHLSLGLIIPIFIFGILLSWIYLKTRSIIPGLMAHSAQNALAFIALA